MKLLSHGCTQQGNTSNRSCVFLIDKPLNMQWFNRKPSNFLHIHLGIVSLGVGVILGLIIFGGVMIGLVLVMGKEMGLVENRAMMMNFLVLIQDS